MRLLGLATALYNRPLLVTLARAQEIERIYQMHASAEGRAALLTPPADPPQPRHELAAPGIVRADAGYYRTADGVAIIPIVGTLVQRGDSMDAMSGLLSYGRIASMLQAAVDDPRADAILFEVDSPGGEANGLMDLTARVASAAQKKPTWAAANEQAFSAAYWLSTAASKIYTPKMGLVGSVGVVMLHVDQSGRDAKQGIVYTPIFAGAHKVDFSPHAPLSDDARAIAQDEVDRLYEMFVGAVAAGRGIDEQAVRDTQAGLLNPNTAIDAGFIDGIASFDETLSAIAAEAKQFRYRGMRSAAEAILAAPPLMHDEPERDQTMADNAGKTFTQTDLDAARLAARAEGETAAKAAAKTEAEKAAAAAAAAAQARISSILTHAEAAGRRKLAEHLAFKTAQSVEDAVAMLTVAPKEAAAPANPLAAAMAGVKNPKVEAGAADADGAKVVQINAAGIYAKRRQQAGHAK